jgi:hypothetical protein
MRKSLSLAWLRAYLDEGSSSFLNAAASAVRAGYNPKRRDTFKVIGYQNKQKWAPKIEAWLDEHGYSEVQLKTKLLQLMEARETRFEKIRGPMLFKKALPEGMRVLAKNGDETLFAIDVAALGIQIKALDLALRVKGLYAAEKHDHGGQVVTVMTLSEEDRQLAREAVRAWRQQMIEERRHAPTFGDT